MPLNTKLKADYIELINMQLDHMPIQHIDEFDLIEKALFNLISPMSGYSVPEPLRNRIDLINELLCSPEDYVENRENYEEYQEIIKERIRAKVNELQSLNEDQKLAVIHAQQERQEAAKCHEQYIAGHQAPLPGSEAHTLSEEEMHLQYTIQFTLESLTNLSVEERLIARQEQYRPLPLVPLFSFTARVGDLNVFSFIALFTLPETNTTNVNSEQISDLVIPNAVQNNYREGLRFFLINSPDINEIHENSNQRPRMR